MIYFDHAATTPVSDSVRESMLPYFSEKFGNPSSIYKLGREAKQAIEDARENIAVLLGCEPKEIFFTSGATEANNLAIKGVSEAAAFKLQGTPHFITTSIEHHSVLDTFKYLEKTFGAEVTYLPVSKEGIIDVSELKKSIKENTALISIMYGNNEVGSIQPISEISKLISEYNEPRIKNNELPIVFHTDAVQAFQYLDLKDTGADMISLTAHKFYGPKGVGLLYVKKGTKLAPQQQGGAQERKMRAGTENVPYIVGMAEAMSQTQINRERAKTEIRELSDYLIERVTKEIPDVELLGPKESDKRLPHIVDFVFKRVEGESILINLDMVEIAASSGSACTSGSLEPSHVTKAMGHSDLEAHGAVRFSLGALNKKEDIDTLMNYLPGIVEKLRAMSPIE